MSNYGVSYCNITTDLIAIDPNINAYDRKRVLSGWVATGGDADEYIVRNSGYVSLLYRDGEDLGAAQASAVDVDSNKEWFYDSTTDSLIVHDTGTIGDRVYEAGEEWTTLKQRVVDEQAERIRSFIGRPIYNRKGTGTESGSSREYDWIIIHANASLAVSDLIRGFDSAKANELEQRIINSGWDVRGEPAGLLDELKAGTYTLWNEITAEKREGVARPVSVTTGSIIDTRGTASTEWDVVKIKIIDAGAVGTATYSTWVRDASGLKKSQIITAQTITGGYDYVGHSVYVRFSNATYTANDEWELEVSGDTIDNPSIQTVSLSRR